MESKVKNFISTRTSRISVCAVLVTFHPQKKLLTKVVQALSPQVNRIVIVDNSEPNQNGLPKSIGGDSVHIISLGGNKGVAAAQNVGIKWARSMGYSHVILMDQDSVPDREMISYLSLALLTLEGDGKKVAAVGPLCYHRGYDTVEPLLIRKKLSMRRVLYQETDRILPVEGLIASGSLISLQTIDNIGMLDESLFIDFIDTEWGFRAQVNGFRCYVACQAKLNHHLGKVSRQKQFSRYLKIIQHPPERYYYQFRNALLLFKKPHIPWHWVAYQIFRQMIPRFILQATIISPQKQNIKMMIIGLWHGFLNITGPYQVNSSMRAPELS